MSEVTLKAGERVDSLSYGTLRLIQRTDGFRFGTDSVLLSDFASLRPRQRVIDLGTGTGVIAILMASREETAAFTAIELQPEIADMAARSVRLNGLEGRIDVKNMDMREAAAHLGYEQYHLAVCNPPYGKAGGAIENPDEHRRLSRHEETCTPDDLAKAAFELLHPGGYLAVVYPAPRALEMMEAMDRRALAPKRVRTVHSRADKAPKLILIEAVKRGGAQLHWLPPLVLENDDGTSTDEWKRIYRI